MPWLSLTTSPAGPATSVGHSSIRTALPAALRFSKLAHETNHLRSAVDGRARGLCLDAVALRPPARRWPRGEPHRSRRRSAAIGVGLLLRPEEGRREDHPARPPLAAIRERDGQQV